MFSEIKVGNTVYVQKNVAYTPYNDYESFWIPLKVSRITPKMFIVDNNRYHKDTGHQVGESFSQAKNLGDKTGGFNNTLVSDETDKMIKFKSDLSKSNVIKAIVNKLDIDYNTSNLDEIFIKMLEIRELL